MAPVPTTTSTSSDDPSDSSDSVHVNSYEGYRDFLASHTERVLDEDGQTVVRVRPRDATLGDLHSFLEAVPYGNDTILRIRPDPRDVWTPPTERQRRNALVPPRLPTAPPLAHHPNGPEPARFRCASCGCWNTVSTISRTQEEGGR